MSGDIPADKLAFLDDLAAVVDGDAETLQRHAELLADSEECRDLRHEVTWLASRLTQAGADYISPDDLEARVLAVIDTRSPAQPSPEPAEPSPDPVRLEADNIAAASPPSRAAQAPIQTQHTGRWLIVALAVAATAIFALGIIHRKTLRPTEPGPNAHLVAPAPENAMTARLANIMPAARAGSDSVEIRNANGTEPANAALGAVVGGGTSIRTDGRTRVELALSDGSVLVLNHNTEMALDRQVPRLLHVRYGEVLADVAFVQDSPSAVFVTPTGRVEVVDTKFGLRVAENLVNVRVLRGAVRLLPKGHGSTQVLRGQEGLMPKDGPTSAAPIGEIADRVAWAELNVEQELEQIPGLGELTGFGPGVRSKREQRLTLTEHKIAVRIVGNLARTEIEETFDNQSQTELDGIFRFPLPPEAQVAGLWLAVDGQWQEAAWVERDRAKQAKRGVTQGPAVDNARKAAQELIWLPGPWRDPALLRWQRGGSLELHISPIPAKGQQSIRLAYTQTISPSGSRRRYVCPLPHSGDEATRVGDFRLDVRATGVDGNSVEARGYAVRQSSNEEVVVLHYVERDFLPAGDLTIEYAIPADDSGLSVWRYEGDATVGPPARARHVENPDLVEQHNAIVADKRPYVAFALRPALPTLSQPQARDVVFVLDASQSMVGERFVRARKLTERLIAELDRNQRFTVLVCDATCRSMDEKPLSPSTGSTTRLRAWLSSIQPAGASDLVAAIRRATGVLETRSYPERNAWLVYIGDGIATVGHRRPSSIAAEVEAVAADTGITFTTVGVGPDADALTLSALARAGGGQYVPYVPGQRLGATALAVLETTHGAALEDPTVELPEGVVDVAPRAPATVRAGQEILLVGRMLEPEVKGEIVLRGTVAGKPFLRRYPVSVEVATTQSNDLLPRLWAAETIEDLELQAKPESRNRMLALSKAYGVASRHTSLVLMEREVMFRSFGLEPANPAPQWTGNEEMQMGASSVASEPSASVLKDVAEARRRRAAGGDITSTGGGARTDNRRRGTKSTWVRRAQVIANAPADPEELRASEEAARALQQNPRSRHRHRSLVRALCRVGNLERAHQVAGQWVARDRLDPEALSYLSDIVGRRGDGEQALRLLTGIVDLQPDNRVLQERLARAFERAGMTERACAHRVALAEILPSDVETVAAALRCERDLGHEKSAKRLLSALSQEEMRQAVLERAERPAGQAPTPGELTLDATWTGSVDVDLTLVTPRSTRLSWMGGHVGLSSRDARSVGREHLGLHRVSNGSYILEVSRLEPHDTTPVKGSVRVQVLGETRSLPFRLEGPRTRVGRITVVPESRRGGDTPASD